MQPVQLRMANYVETCSVSYNKERKKDEQQPMLHIGYK
jgi:hypothetical protein